MFVAVSRLTFEDEPSAYDNKELKSLCERIKSRFQVCVKVENSSQSFPRIVISALEHSQAVLDKKLDQVTDYCENSGFGRISQEEVFYEHVENLFTDSF